MRRALLGLALVLAAGPALAQGYLRAFLKDPAAAGFVVRTTQNTTVARIITASAGGVCTGGDGQASNPACGPDLASTNQFIVGTVSPPATCTAGREIYVETDQLRACVCSATNTWTCNGKLRAHATDCTALTDGLADEMCFERDADTVYVCEPSAGGCDTAGEWKVVSGGSGAPTGAKYIVAQLDAGLSAEIAPASDDQAIVSDSSSAATWRSLPNGPVKYATSSNTFAQDAGVISHATDCTAVTTGIADDLCVELDSERLFSCQPTAGGCDTAGEWILTGDGAGGSLDIVGLTAEPLITLDDSLPFYDLSATVNRRVTFRELAARVGRKYQVLESDFFNNGDEGWMDSSGVSTGTFIPIPGEDGRNGIIRYGTFTSATGGAGYNNIQSTVNGVMSIQPASGQIVFEAWVRLPTLSDATDTYKVWLGLTNVGFAVTGVPTDAIALTYTHSANSGKWQGTCIEDSATTTADDAGTAVAAATWYRVGFVVNAAATSVSFYVNGTEIGTACATNVPDAGDDLTTNSFILKSAATGIRFMELDAVTYWLELTTAR